MTYKLDYTSVALGQQLVLAVVNNSDWDTDDHTQSCNGLDKAMTWATNCFMELGNFTAVILSGCPVTRMIVGTVQLRINLDSFR